MYTIDTLRTIVETVCGRNRQDAKTIYNRVSNCCEVLNVLKEADNTCYASILMSITFGFYPCNSFVKYGMYDEILGKWIVNEEKFRKNHPKYDKDNPLKQMKSSKINFDAIHKALLSIIS